MVLCVYQGILIHDMMFGYSEGAAISNKLQNAGKPTYKLIIATTRSDITHEGRVGRVSMISQKCKEHVPVPTIQTGPWDSERMPLPEKMDICELPSRS